MMIQTHNYDGRKRGELLELGFHSLTKLSNRLEKVSFSQWAEDFATASLQVGLTIPHNEVQWLWDTLTHDPTLPLDIYKKLLSPEEEFKQRPPVLAAKAGSVFGIFLQGIPQTIADFEAHHFSVDVWLDIGEDLYMEPGRGMRFKCRDVTCHITLSVSDPGDVELEAQRLRIPPKFVDIHGDRIHAEASSLSNAYAIATRRLQPGRRSEGGKAYNYIALLQFLEPPQEKRYIPLEAIRTEIEKGRWSLH